MKVKESGNAGAIALARRIAVAIQGQEWAAALELIDQGAREYPSAQLPSGMTWAALREIVSANLPAEPAPEQEPEQDQVAPEAAAPESAPVGEAAESLPTLTTEHTVENGTVLLGSPKGEIGKRVSAVMGKDGQRWAFSFRLQSHGVPGWYIRASREGGPDMGRIARAESALRAAGFTVERGTIEGEGTPPKLSKTAQQAKARTANSLAWHLTTEGGLSCTEPECEATGLHTQTAKIVDDPEGLRVVCLAHDGTAPVVDTPAEPVAPVLPDADGQDQDQEEEPKPARKTRVAKATPKAGQPTGLAALDMGTLVDLLAQTGNSAVVEEIKRRMIVPVSAPPARRTSRATPDPMAELARVTPPVRRARKTPVSASPAMQLPAEGPLTFVVEISGKVRATASDLRRNLYAKVTHVSRRHGVEIHVFADRDARTATVTVTLDGDQRAREQVAAKVVKAAEATCGVASVEIQDSLVNA